MKDGLTTPEIRNKIQPIVHLINVIELGEDKETIDKFLENAKKYVNIMCDQKVFKE